MGCAGSGAAVGPRFWCWGEAKDLQLREGVPDAGEMPGVATNRCGAQALER